MLRYLLFPLAVGCSSSVTTEGSDIDPTGGAQGVAGNPSVTVAAAGTGSGAEPFRGGAALSQNTGGVVSAPPAPSTVVVSEVPQHVVTDQPVDISRPWAMQCTIITGSFSFLDANDKEIWYTIDGCWSTKGLFRVTGDFTVWIIPLANGDEIECGASFDDPWNPCKLFGY